MRKLLIDVPAVLGLVVARVKALAGNQAENGADADHKNCEPSSGMPKNSWRRAFDPSRRPPAGGLLRMREYRILKVCLTLRRPHRDAACGGSSVQVGRLEGCSQSYRHFSAPR